MAGGAGAVAATLGWSQRASAADINLSIWTGYPELVPFYQAIGNAYSKLHPGVTFSFLSSSLREAEQKLAAAVPTGTGPDIYDTGTNISINFIDGGLLQPNPPDIDQYFKSGPWSSSVVEYFTLNGKTYGLPLMDGSRASLYYNKTMFAEAGIANPPATFGELMAAARKLVRVDASGKMTRSGISLRLSGQGAGITEKFRFVLEAAGGALVTPVAGGKWHNGFDNAAGRDALKFYVDAVQTYKVDDPRTQHDADAFVAGNTAMLMREAWVIGEVQQKNPSLQYGVVPIPKWTETGTYKMLLQPWPIYVNSKGRNQTAAWDFLQFLTNPENSLRLTDMTGWVTERQDVDWKPVLAKTPQFDVFVAPPKDVVFYTDPIFGPFDEIQSRMADKLTAAFINPALQGNAEKIAQSIHDMAVQTDQILKDNELYGAH
jgi:multiple sugar transport system substrate-binding protein